MERIQEIQNQRRIELEKTPLFQEYLEKRRRHSIVFEQMFDYFDFTIFNDR